MKSRQLFLGAFLVIVCLTTLAVLWGPTLAGSPPIDAANGNKPSAADAGTLKIYNVPAGSAEGLVRTLQQRFQKSPAIRISAAGSDRIVVYATPQDHDAIASQISMKKSRSVPAENSMRPYVIGSLNYSRAEEVARVLRQQYPAGGKSAMTIAADPRTNLIIVRCTAGEHDEVRKLVERLDIKVEKKE
jgi:type II secretory pathway component GspD/PulD (secretin)